MCSYNTLQHKLLKKVITLLEISEDQTHNGRTVSIQLHVEHHMDEYDLKRAERNLHFKSFSVQFSYLISIETI